MRTRPVRSGLRAAVALTGCLLLVGLFTAITPETTDFRRSYRAVEVGERAELRKFDVTVTEVRLARAIAGRQPEFVSEHALIIVALRSDARADTVLLSDVVLQTRDDHRYEPRGEFAGYAVPSVQPGFSGFGTAIFEVPWSRMPGAALIVGPDAGTFDGYDAAARVELGLDAGAPIAEEPVALTEARREVTR